MRTGNQDINLCIIRKLNENYYDPFNECKHKEGVKR